MKIHEDATDEHIVEAVLSGSNEAFTILVERYRNRIYSIGYRFFYNSDDASDFCQDVFIKVYSKLETYRFSSPFKYWLGRIAYNHGINNKKRRSVLEHSHESVDLLSGERVEPPVEQDEIQTLLREAVDTLPEQYRVCIDMYYYWGFSFKQISAVTDFPLNTIKSYVFRARSLLRDRLRGTIAEEYHEL